MSEGATKAGSAGFILFGALQVLIGLACATFTLYIASGSEIAVYFALQTEPRTRRDDAPHRVT